MGDTIVIETPVATVLEVSGLQGPQGPPGASQADVLTVQGDLLYRGASAAQRLGIGTAGQILKVNSGGTAPEWGAAPAAGVSSVNGDTGSVVLDAADVGAAATTHAAEHEAGEADEIQAMAALVITVGGTNVDGVYFYDGTLTSGRPNFFRVGTRKNTKLQWNNARSKWELYRNLTLEAEEAAAGTSAKPWDAVEWEDPRTPPVISSINVTRLGLEDMTQKLAETGALATATASEDGLMSAADKTKLNGIASGATANTASSATPSTLGTAAAGSSSDYSRADHVHSAEVSDSAFRVIGSTDATKKVALEVDTNVPTGTTVTLTSPASSGTLMLNNIGSTSGLPLVTTTAGAITTLALGSAGQVLKVNSGGTAVEFGAAGGVTSGSVDNAVLRADGTGGSTSQSSALSVDDAVVPFSITGDASTDVITAVGHNFTTNQGVRFPTLTGGSGLTAATTTYFVRDISGDTFKVSTTSGGAAVNFTTNITAGTVIAMQANVAIRNNSSETTSAIVLTPKGTNGAFIVGEKQDGTITGGNPRGNGAIDICTNVEFARTAATQVASGTSSTICGGSRQTASGSGSGVFGGADNTASNVYSVVCGGITNTASGDRSAVVGGRQNIASGTHSCVVNSFNTASAIDSFACGSRAGADRLGLLAHASGFFSLLADAQRIRAVLRNKTTNATATELFLDGSSTRLTIPSGKVMAGIINCVGVKSDGSAVAHFIRKFCCKNVAGTSSLVGTVTTIGTDQEDNASTDISVTVSDANDAVTISVTGIASETWRWVASVDACEVSYGT